MTLKVGSFYRGVKMKRQTTILGLITAIAYAQGEVSRTEAATAAISWEPASSVLAQEWKSDQLAIFLILDSPRKVRDLDFSFEWTTSLDLTKNLRGI